MPITCQASHSTVGAAYLKRDIFHKTVPERKPAASTGTQLKSRPHVLNAALSAALEMISNQGVPSASVSSDSFNTGDFRLTYGLQN